MSLHVDNDNLGFWLAIIITALWAISFFVDIVVKSYEANPSVHALMLLAAGYGFRGALPGSNKNKENE